MEENFILYENFENEGLDSSLVWRCEPEKWFLDRTSSQLILETDEETDYWQKTHYGFRVDNGHFLYAKISGNFKMTTRVQITPKNRYDQAGLMIRISENTWVKTSLEFIPDGPSKLGVVVTNRGYSDWSTKQVECEDTVQLYYQLSRIDQNCYVNYSWDGKEWFQIRIAHIDISGDSPILAGVYACSPQGKGQEVRFGYLSIEELDNDPNSAYL